MVACVCVYTHTHTHIYIYIYIGAVLQIGRSLVRSQLVSGFFIGIKSFRLHHGPGVDSASNKGVPGVFPRGKGGRCVRLTTYHPPVPLLQNLGNLTSWNPLGLSRPLMGLLYLYIYIYIYIYHNLKNCVTVHGSLQNLLKCISLLSC